ncbi:MAG: sugar phosphate isomerase/epimerase family protein [Oscillospiraceae bacterium]|jgi:sugar phosphate isomerase/epimerase
MSSVEHGKSRYAFSTGALYPLETEEAFRRIKDAGFENAEMMPQALSDVSDASALRFDRTGIRISSIHFPLVFFGMLYNAQKTMIDDGRRFSDRLLSLGSRMGTEVLVVHPYVPSVEGYPELLDKPVSDNLMWLADRCLKYGITMAMENSPKSCSTPQKLLDYIASFGDSGIKPMVDTTEVCEAGGDPAEFISKAKPCHLHLSDFGGGKKHLPAGEGEIDWEAVRAALTGYEGYYTLEPSYRYYLSDIDEKLRKAHMFLENWMPE